MTDYAEPTVTREIALQTLQRIRSAAESALAEGVAAICLTVRREHAPTGAHVLLATNSGPRGELLNVRRECGFYQVTARFRAAQVIRWATKAIEMTLRFGPVVAG